jgi:peptidoglycan/xylan/chitin deacetylase (PgdA/CDA1 family)
MAPAALRWADLRSRVAPRLSGLGERGHVALTFDDGPDPEGTPAVLAALDRLGVRATFFLLGEQTARHPATARAVADAGHEVATHGLTHRNPLSVPPWAAGHRLREACSLVEKATGTAPHWFRPPYGVLTAGELAAAAQSGLRPVLWTAWGRDWEHRPAHSVAAHVRADLRPGGTVLLHDSGSATPVRGSWRATVAALPDIVAAAAAMGCAVGPLGEHGIT